MLHAQILSVQIEIHGESSLEAATSAILMNIIRHSL